MALAVMSQTAVRRNVTARPLVTDLWRLRGFFLGIGGGMLTRATTSLRLGTNQCSVVLTCRRGVSRRRRRRGHHQRTSRLPIQGFPSPRISPALDFSPMCAATSFPTIPRRWRDFLCFCKQRRKMRIAANLLPLNANSEPPTHMRCRMTASLRATAITARRCLRVLASRAFPKPSAMTTARCA